MATIIPNATHNRSDTAVSVSTAVSLTSLIAQCTTTHQLTPDEVQRLVRVLSDYPPAEQSEEFGNELDCILAARKLATMAPLTAEQIDRARLAVESGRTAFVPQEVD